MLAATVVFQAGWYDASALRPHFQFVHTLIERGMQQSVRFHARGIVAPTAAAGAVARGGAVFRQHCEQCHGGPGVAMGTIGLSMQPVPGPLADAARRWKVGELYWITANGIKMSGMPAWRFHLSETELWDVVAFLGALPAVTPAAYAAIRKQAAAPRLELEQPPQAAARVPDRERGKLALTQFACQSCHQIPGVTGPLTYVGPKLDGLAQRSVIAGKLATTEENLVKWILTPQQIKPGTAMPQLNVPARDARDMAAYLLQATR